MSEYQYYEFQALDRTLTSSDRNYLKQLSSRVKLTATSATFVYNYRDFPDQVTKVLDRCFDLVLYVANFGVRRLAIRFPLGGINLARFEPYCVPYCVTVTTTKKSAILDISLSAEEYYDWIEGEGWLSDLVALREELLQGDLRLLYLVWLRSQFTENCDADPENSVEPPVPANLQQLSPALKTAVKFFAIDRDLLAAVAEVSPTEDAIAEPIADWIAALPESERNAYLLRVARGETHVGAELIQQLRQQFSRDGEKSSCADAGRTVAAILAIATQKRNQRKHQEKLAARAAKRKRLDAIAPKAESLWQEVVRLIERKQAKSYDDAVEQLQELRDLAEYQGNLPHFQARIQHLQQQYRNRPAFLSRLQKARLIPVKQQ